MCWTAIWELGCALVLCYGLFQKKPTTEQQVGGDGDDKKLSGRDIEVLANGISRG